MIKALVVPLLNGSLAQFSDVCEQCYHLFLRYVGRVPELVVQRGDAAVDGQPPHLPGELLAAEHGPGRGGGGDVRHRRGEGVVVAGEE